MSWSAHVNARLKKSNRVLHALRENVVLKVKTFIKLGLYKSLVSPVLLFGMNCVQMTKTDLQNIEKFQRRAVKWITSQLEGQYLTSLQLLNILPLPMYMQLNDLLTFSKFFHEKPDGVEFSELTESRGRSTELFNLRKVRLKKARSEFIFKTARTVNKTNSDFDFLKREGLKNRILNVMWIFVNKYFS